MKSVQKSKLINMLIVKFDLNGMKKKIVSVDDI